jgi:hypothetical protein
MIGDSLVVLSLEQSIPCLRKAIYRKLCKTAQAARVHGILYKNRDTAYVFLETDLMFTRIRYGVYVYLW